MTEAKTTEFVDEVLDSLTGAAEETDRSGQRLREHIERAAKELDDEAARKSGEAVLDRLAKDPYDQRALEALIVLGLSHPDVLAEHKVPLGQEGKRLAMLLERRGEVDRAHALLELLAQKLPTDKKITHQLASMLRRTGNADRLVERYLVRAREAVAAGRPMDAVPWLQEALLIDRSRRDIARMIRDLRFESLERRERTVYHLKRILVIAFICALCAGAFLWEQRCEREYAAIPPADMAELASLRERLNALDDLMDRAPLWLGVMKVSSERAELRISIQKIVSSKAESERAIQDARDRQIEQADAAMTRGQMKSENGEFSAALADFKEALEACPSDWSERPRVEKNIQAILDWQAKNPAGTGK